MNRSYIVKGITRNTIGTDPNFLGRPHPQCLFPDCAKRIGDFVFIPLESRAVDDLLVFRVNVRTDAQLDTFASQS